jgi:hypothetical protein
VIRADRIGGIPESAVIGFKLSAGAEAGRDVEGTFA